MDHPSIEDNLADGNDQAEPEAARLAASVTDEMAERILSQLSARDSERQAVRADECTQKHNLKAAANSLEAVSTELAAAGCADEADLLDRNIQAMRTRSN